MEYKFGYVGIIGRPNAGKSTLVNHFVGEKVSIISPKPQTTRNNILGILNSEFEQIVFVDTPGIHLAKNGLDKFMMKNIRSAQDNVNCIVYVMDGLKPFSSNEMAYINDLCEKEIPIIVAVNKIDKTKFEKLYPELAKLNDLKKILDIVPISALNGENSDVLLEKIRNTLTVVGGKDEFDLPLDEYTDKSTLFMLCEIVREKALILLDEEIPHGIAVVVSKFEEKEEIFEIEVEIFCEKDSHKNIIIGKNGSMAKEIGISARKDMEQLLGKKVMLQIWVRTKKNWRDNPSVLNDIGYNLKIDV